MNGFMIEKNEGIEWEVGWIINNKRERIERDREWTDI